MIDIKKISGSSAYISEKKIKELLGNEYQLQAINFLIDTDTKCEIVPQGSRLPSWGKCLVNAYQVTLSNKNGAYAFDFYYSISNTKKRISARLDFYSVLACLNIYTPENFDEFCSEFGYSFEDESEYIKAKMVHLSCIDQQKSLRKIFSIDQLEKLSEIS